MPDTTVAVWLKVENDNVVGDLHDVCDRLDSAEPEVVLDFSMVRRIDPSAIAAIDRLATSAEQLAVRVVLRGVNVEVYRVLKLVKLAPRFSFLN